VTLVETEPRETSARRTVETVESSCLQILWETLMLRTLRGKHRERISIEAWGVSSNDWR
jgi:hypothetical protein